MRSTRRLTSMLLGLALLVAASRPASRHRIQWIAGGASDLWRADCGRGVRGAGHDAHRHLRRVHRLRIRRRLLRPATSCPCTPACRVATSKPCGRSCAPASSASRPPRSGLRRRPPGRRPAPVLYLPATPWAPCCTSTVEPTTCSTCSCVGRPRGRCRQAGGLTGLAELRPSAGWPRCRCPPRSLSPHSRRFTARPGPRGAGAGPDRRRGRDHPVDVGQRSHAGWLGAARVHGGPVGRRQDHG